MSSDDSDLLLGMIQKLCLRVESVERMVVSLDVKVCGGLNAQQECIRDLDKRVGALEIIYKKVIT